MLFVEDLKISSFQTLLLFILRGVKLLWQVLQKTLT